MASIHIGFPTAIDGRLDRIVQNLGEVKPTFVAAVPRIFEKVYNKIVSGAKEKGKTTHRIFKWSLRVGSEVSALRQEGLEPKSLLKLKYGMANVLVFNKIKKLMKFTEITKIQSSMLKSTKTVNPQNHWKLEKGEFAI